MSRYPYYHDKNDKRPRDNSGGRIYTGFQSKPSGLIETVRPVTLFNQYVEPIAYNVVKKSTPDIVYPATNGPVYLNEATGEITEVWIKYNPIVGISMFYAFVAYGIFTISGGNPTSSMIFEADGISTTWDPALLTWNNKPTATLSFGSDLLFEFADNGGSMLGDVPYIDDGFSHGHAISNSFAGVFHGIRIRGSNSGLNPGEIRNCEYARQSFVLVNAQ